MGKMICLDFDGVLHSYLSGWKGDATIPDPPTDGAVDWCNEMIQKYYLVVFSSRAATTDGVNAIRRWLDKWGFPEMEITNEKPLAFLTIDDRALTFTGSWADFHLTELESFKPWNKR